MSTVQPRMLDRVRQRLGPGEVTVDSVAAAALAAGVVLGDDGVRDLVDALQAHVQGLGPLQALLADPEVTDVLVNGAHGVWVDRGRGVERVRVDLGGEGAVRALAGRLASLAGRRLDDASPFVDARLPRGLRLHVALQPLVDGGTHISLRVPSRRTLHLPDLTARAAVPPSWVPVVEALVHQRRAFLVSGGTGAGKTTLLGALLAMVSPAERIVLVEDCAELQVEHPHVVRLQSRAANVEGRGAITLTDLVRQALRMRPDRLVVGEVRGGEVRELLTALNTGHDGGCGTVHANDATEVPSRLIALGALAGMDPDAVHTQVAAAVHVVLHLQRVRGLRRLVQVAVVHPQDGRCQVLPALTALPDDALAPGVRGPGWELLQQWGMSGPAA